MSPSYFLLLMICATLTGLLAQWKLRRVHRLAIAELARQWNMHYVSDDRFRLSDRVAEMLPIPGAAQVRVTDLIYGNEGDGYRYVFSAWFTEGVISSKRRRVRVATFHEPSGAEADDRGAGPLIVAPEGGSILAQYQQVRDMLAKR